MKIPAIPSNEIDRVDKLHALNVLDTPPEERFDRLTRMARRMFRVPIALVSLVDTNRQWFKSCDGLTVSEMSREISFCGHAILGDDIFLIPDALLDEDFHDNPLVTNDPHIRFYAGCPLRTIDGTKVGTLCVIDTHPRAFDEDDATALRDLAKMVEDELVAFQISTTDELTKISNRRGFLTLAEFSLNLCARQNITSSLVFFDLDRFKQINDEFGHLAGDRALIDFADVLKNTFRVSDIFARLGGDEFVTILSSTTKQQAQLAIQNLNRNLDILNSESKSGYVISFSYGITEFDGMKHSSVEDLLANADKSMYIHKTSKITARERKIF